MDKLLNLFYFCTFDPKVYMLLPQLYRDGLFELQWRKTAARPWQMRLRGTHQWHCFGRDELVAELQKAKVDMTAFEIELNKVIVQQVVFADSVLQEARTVLGSKAVDTSIEEHRRFFSEIKEAVLQLTQDDRAAVSPQRLRLIKDSESVHEI